MCESLYVCVLADWLVFLSCATPRFQGHARRPFRTPARTSICRGEVKSAKSPPLDGCAGRSPAKPYCTTPDLVSETTTRAAVSACVLVLAFASEYVLVDTARTVAGPPRERGRRDARERHRARDATSAGRAAATPTPRRLVVAAVCIVFSCSWFFFFFFSCGLRASRRFFIHTFGARRRCARDVRWSGRRAKSQERADAIAVSRKAHGLCVR